MVAESAPGRTFWGGGRSCRSGGMARFPGSLVCHWNRHRRGWWLFGAVIRAVKTQLTDIMNSHETTRELKTARDKYCGQIIPKSALAVMDAETARLAAPNLAAQALQVGDSAPDFILPDAQDR